MGHIVSPLSIRTLVLSLPSVHNKNVYRSISSEKTSVLDSNFIHTHIIINLDQFRVKSTNYYRVMALFIPRHMIVVGYYGFMLDVRVSVRLSISRTSVLPFFVSG